MSTTARKARKRQRHQFIRASTDWQAFGPESRDFMARRAEELRFAKPAKVGTPMRDRHSFQWVVPTWGKNKGRQTPRSLEQQYREVVAREGE